MAPPLSTFEKLWAKNPTSILFARLADAYRDQGDLDRAVEVCRRGLRYRPSYATGHMVLGRCLQETGSIVEARQEFEKVLRLDPDHVAALQHLGRIERESGMYEHALRRFRAAYAADPFSSELSRAVAELEELCSPIGEENPYVGDEGDAAAAPDVDSDAISDVATVVDATDAPEPPAPRFAGKGLPPRQSFVGTVLSPAAEKVPGGGRTLSAGGENGDDAAEASQTQSSPPSDVEDRRVITLTLADLYVSQGYVDRALEVLESLVASHPDDDRYRRRLQEIRTMDA